MKRISALVLVLMFAALPLRGMAAVIADLCGPQQSAAMPVSQDCCNSDDVQQADTHHGGQGHSDDGSCSHCAACSVGAPVLSEFKSALPEAIHLTGVVPFRDRHARSFVPETLDRPPLPL